MHMKVSVHHIRLLPSPYSSKLIIHLPAFFKAFTLQKIPLSKSKFVCVCGGGGVWKGAHLHNKWYTCIVYMIILSNLNFSIQVIIKHLVYKVYLLLGMYACVYRVLSRKIILGVGMTVVPTLIELCFKC